MSIYNNKNPILDINFPSICNLKAVKDLSVTQVAQLLGYLYLNCYSSIFCKYNITGAILLKLTNEYCTTTLEMTVEDASRLLQIRESVKLNSSDPQRKAILNDRKLFTATQFTCYYFAVHKFNKIYDALCRHGYYNFKNIKQDMEQGGNKLKKIFETNQYLIIQYMNKNVLFYRYLFNKYLDQYFRSFIECKSVAFQRPIDLLALDEDRKLYKELNISSIDKTKFKNIISNLKKVQFKNKKRNERLNAAPQIDLTKLYGNGHTGIYYEPEQQSSDRFYGNIDKCIKCSITLKNPKYPLCPRCAYTYYQASLGKGYLKGNKQQEKNNKFKIVICPDCNEQISINRWASHPFSCKSGPFSNNIDHIEDDCETQSIITINSETSQNTIKHHHPQSHPYKLIENRILQNNGAFNNLDMTDYPNDDEPMLPNHENNVDIQNDEHGEENEEESKNSELETQDQPPESPNSDKEIAQDIKTALYSQFKGTDMPSIDNLNLYLNLTKIKQINFAEPPPVHFSSEILSNQELRKVAIETTKEIIDHKANHRQNLLQMKPNNKNDNNLTKENLKKFDKNNQGLNKNQQVKTILRKNKINPRSSGKKVSRSQSVFVQSHSKKSNRKRLDHQSVEFDISECLCGSNNLDDCFCDRS